MSYKNGGEVLPPKLLKEIQKYIQGELIYIPKEEDKRAAWGELSGSRRDLLKRNKEIFHAYNKGTSVMDLSSHYCLSIDSIKKIIVNLRKTV